MISKKTGINKTIFRTPSHVCPAWNRQKSPTSRKVRRFSKSLERADLYFPKEKVEAPAIGFSASVCVTWVILNNKRSGAVADRQQWVIISGLVHNRYKTNIYPATHRYLRVHTLDYKNKVVQRNVSPRRFRAFMRPWNKRPSERMVRLMGAASERRQETTNIRNVLTVWTR